MITQALNLTLEEFRVLREFFYRHTGMSFEETKRYFVDKRVMARMEETGVRSFAEYIRLVRFQADGAELQELINALTVNETYFFRDEKQFQCLVRDLLPEIVEANPARRSIRIWSAPCSSGEEPYSIALYLLEFWEKADDYEIEIVGTDIDTDIIKQAYRGVYSSRSVQHLPADILAKYFTPIGNGTYQICDDLRSSIDLERVNIVDPKQTRSFRNFDVIFSRNMLIYFDDTSRRIAADTFFEALRPGGFLCLAPSESMSRVCPLFKLRPFNGASAYQKPGKPK